MSSSPSSSPFFTSNTGHPNVDWVDVLGHFLDGDETQRAVESSQGEQGAKEQPPLTVTPNPEPPQNMAQAPACMSKSTSTSQQLPEEHKLSAEEKARLRSERKRSREKQRRSDVNTQFNDLTALLKKIEAENEDGERIELTSSSSMNRVDLIGKTIAILNRIHNENRKRKCTIDELQDELRETKKRADEASKKLQKESSTQEKSSDHVMMMVPMMVKPDGTAQAPFMPQTMPFYGMCQPNMADKSGAANYGAAMFNPFMYGKQPFSAPSEGQEKNKSSEQPSSQQSFVPAMVPMPMGNSGDNNLAHCA